jgi:hypothetical protein
MLPRLVVLCFLAGCGAPAPAPVTGSFPLEVGPAGGVIEGAVGTDLQGLKLEIPAGALTSAITIDAAFTDEEPELGPGSNFVGPSFQFFPRAQTFAKPVKVTVPVAPSTLDSYGQTTESCLMWIRAADESWSQATPVGFTETLVTAETSTLVQAAVGVKSTLIIVPPHPLTLACTNPAGFCVDVNPENLRSGNTGWSSVTNNRKMLYRRAVIDAGVTRTYISEYDLVLGRHTYESQPYVPPAGTAPNFAPGVGTNLQVARGPDDAGWTPLAHGLVRFPPSGAPVLFPDTQANGKTTGVVVTPDGRRHRQLLSGSSTLTMRIATTTGTTEAAPVTVETSTLNLFQVTIPFGQLGDTNALTYQWPSSPLTRAVELTPPGAATLVPLHPDVRPASSHSGILALVASDDGELVATATYGYPVNLYVQSRDGRVSRALAGLPRLSVLEFGEPGFLYAGSNLAAHVYRVEIATGAIQTIELTSSTDPDDIAARTPMALRRVVIPATSTLPARHVMYVIAGTASSNRSVLLVRSAQ